MDYDTWLRSQVDIEPENEKIDDLGYELYQLKEEFDLVMNRVYSGCLNDSDIQEAEELRAKINAKEAEYNAEEELWLEKQAEEERLSIEAQNELELYDYYEDEANIPF